MLSSFAISHVGNKRKDNQDTVACYDDEKIWILADGMGGNRGGELASAIACEQCYLALKAGDSIEQALTHAHEKILQIGLEQPEFAGLGSTITLIRAIDGQHYQFAWVGDSRIYLFRQGKLVQLSRDHSVVQRLLDIGVLTQQEADNHPNRHLITACLGQTSQTSKQLEMGISEGQWRSEDTLLMCSDGLSDELPLNELEALLKRHHRGEHAAQKLLDQALALGGSDNISLVLINANFKPALWRRLWPFSWMIK